MATIDTPTGTNSVKQWFSNLRLRGAVSWHLAIIYGAVIGVFVTAGYNYASQQWDLLITPPKGVDADKAAALAAEFDRKCNQEPDFKPVDDGYYVASKSNAFYQGSRDSFSRARDRAWWESSSSCQYSRISEPKREWASGYLNPVYYSKGLLVRVVWQKGKALPTTTKRKVKIFFSVQGRDLRVASVLDTIATPIQRTKTSRDSLARHTTASPHLRRGPKGKPLASRSWLIVARSRTRSAVNVIARARRGNFVDSLATRLGYCSSFILRGPSKQSVTLNCVQQSRFVVVEQCQELRMGSQPNIDHLDLI